MKRLALLLPLFSCLLFSQARIPGPGGESLAASGISFIQAQSNSATHATSVSKAITASTGHSLVVYASDQCGGVLSISDGTNTYAATGSGLITSQDGVVSEMWTSFAITGGTLTVTVATTATVCGGAGNPSVTIGEFAGATGIVGNASGGAAPGGGTNPEVSGAFSSGGSTGQLVVAGMSNYYGGTAAFTAGNPTGMVIPSGATSAVNQAQSMEYVVLTGSATTASYSQSAANTGENTILVAVIH